MNSSAFESLGVYLNRNPGAYTEIYTLSGIMYYTDGNNWFREGTSTPLTLEQLKLELATRTIKAIESNGTVWSIPGLDIRDEDTYEITNRPYVSSRSDDTCSICLEPLDSGICKLSNSSCPHMFHCDCINSWVGSRDGDISCPECRQTAGGIVPVRYTSFGFCSLHRDIRYLLSL